MADPLFAPRDCLKHIHRADNIDACSQWRIGPAKRHLQGCKVNDIANLILVERALERRQVGNVATHKGHFRQLSFGHNQLEPARVAGEIEHHRRGALTRQVAHHPRADTAQRARNKETFRRHVILSIVVFATVLDFRPAGEITKNI